MTAAPEHPRVSPGPELASAVEPEPQHESFRVQLPSSSLCQAPLLAEFPALVPVRLEVSSQVPFQTELGVLCFALLGFLLLFQTRLANLG